MEWEIGSMRGVQRTTDDLCSAVLCDCDDVILLAKAPEWLLVSDPVFAALRPGGRRGERLQCLGSYRERCFVLGSDARRQLLDSL